MEQLFLMGPCSLPRTTLPKCDLPIIGDSLNLQRGQIPNGSLFFASNNYCLSAIFQLLEILSTFKGPNFRVFRLLTKEWGFRYGFSLFFFIFLTKWFSAEIT